MNRKCLTKTWNVIIQMWNKMRKQSQITSMMMSDSWIRDSCNEYFAKWPHKTLKSDRTKFFPEFKGSIRTVQGQLQFGITQNNPYESTIIIRSRKLSNVCSDRLLDRWPPRHCVVTLMLHYSGSVFSILDIFNNEGNVWPDLTCLQRWISDFWPDLTRAFLNQ